MKKKSRKNIIAIMIALLILCLIGICMILGLTNKKNKNSNNNINNTNVNTKNDSSNTSTRLTSKELLEIEQFLNDKEVNGFISHNIYNNIDGIDLNMVFYNANVKEKLNEQIKNEYLSAINAKEIASNLTVITPNYIKTTYQKYTNAEISNEEIKNRLNSTYLQKYDVYCDEHSDTNYITVKCTNGKKSNDTYTIYLSYPDGTFYNDRALKTSVLTLKKIEDSYVFVSNIAK